MFKEMFVLLVAGFQKRPNIPSKDVALKVENAPTLLQTEPTTSTEEMWKKSATRN